MWNFRTNFAKAGIFLKNFKITNLHTNTKKHKLFRVGLSTKVIRELTPLKHWTLSASFFLPHKIVDIYLFKLVDNQSISPVQEASWPWPMWHCTAWPLWHSSVTVMEITAAPRRAQCQPAAIIPVSGGFCLHFSWKNWENFALHGKLVIEFRLFDGSCSLVWFV